MNDYIMFIYIYIYDIYIYNMYICILYIDLRIIIHSTGHQTDG